MFAIYHLAALTLLPLTLAAPPESNRLTADEAARIREATIPSGPELWETIPWLTDLDLAREEARRSSRLIFLWSMNGHPCGAT